MDRRDFIKGLAFASGGVILDPNAMAVIEAEALRSGFSILQGFTDETTVQFTVDVPLRMKVHYEVVDPATSKVFSPFSVDSASRPHSLERVDKIIFINLYLNESFILIARDENNRIIDQREFKTLNTKSKSARVLFLSCMLDVSPQRKKMWKLVQETDPDMIFLLGDNVYGDFFGMIHGPKVLWMRYLQTRRTIPFYRSRKLTPTIAIWDDHDFGKNNVSGAYKHKEHSLQTFKDFYAQSPIGPAYRVGPGVASSFTGFGQKFIFLDGRYWRKLPGQYGVGYFGDEQLAWLQEELSHTHAKTWIFQGSQFFSGHQEDGGTYRSIAPDEFSAFLNMVRGHDKQTYFVSGDVHFSEVAQIPHDLLGFDSFEFTSSCLHSLINLHPPKNQLRVEGAKRENFMALDILSPDVQEVTCFGHKHNVHFNIEV